MHYERDEREMPPSGLGDGDYRHSALTRVVMDHLPIYEAEVAGLDEAGFKAWVRAKLQVVGDSLLAAWKDRG